MNRFSEVKRRVCSALSTAQNISLKVALAKRISADPLYYLDGATDQDKFKIFKHSLISIFNVRKEDKDNQVLLHLVRVLLDTNNIQDSRNERGIQQSGIQADNCVQDDTKTCKRTLSLKPSLKPVLSKKKKVKSSLSKTVKSSTVSEVNVNNMDIGPVSYTPVLSPVVLNNKSTLVSSPIEQVIPLPSGNELDPLPNIAQTGAEKGKRKNKNKNARKRNTHSNVGSCSPSSPQNVKAARLLDGAGRENVTVSTETAMAHWEFVNGFIRLSKVNELLSIPPQSFGLECHVESVSKCSECMKGVLLTPITDCDAVGCSDDTHKRFNFLFPHGKLADFSIQAIHDENDLKSVLHDLVQRMYKHEMLPSIHYVATHDRDADKICSVSRYLSTLRKSVDYYMGSH